MRVRFECVPCAVEHSVPVLQVVLNDNATVDVPCPESSTLFRLSVTAGQWWSIMLAKGRVLEELEWAAAELELAKTPADIGGCL